MNNEDIPKMEEGMIASTGVPTTTETSMNSSTASNTNKRLSTVSKMYDTSGKGELDDVQLAMRNMDQTGRGYLTNDKVYGLMQEQLKMQKSMFQMKKIIIGLMVFVVILALSNLGTSFASAILAKDATTNDKDELVSKATGEVVATGKSVETFQGVPPNDVSGRKLCVTTTGGGQPETICESYSADYTMMLDADAHAMLAACKKNRLVKMTYTMNDGTDVAAVYERTLCNPEWGCANQYYGPKNAPTTGDLCVGSTGPETVYVRPHDLIRGMYSISSSSSFVASSFANEYEQCTVDEDCIAGLTCQLSVTAVDPGEVVACSDDNPCMFGLSCFNGFCGNCNERDHSACLSDPARPVCTTFNNAAPASCGCNSNDDCDIVAGESCGTSSCEQSPFKFCSTDHDADRGGCFNECKQATVQEGTQTLCGGVVCDDGQFCKQDGCGDGSAGTCAPKPDSCITTVDEVCGCDGNTHSNSCFAELAGVNIVSDGQCPKDGRN